MKSRMRNEDHQDIEEEVPHQALIPNEGFDP